MITAHKRLLRLRALLLGQVASDSILEDVRLLLAGGVLQWKATDLNDLENVALLVPSIAFAALWPLVIADDLPQDWPFALQEITSPELARQIANLRQERSDVPYVNVAMRLMQELAKPSLALGVHNLFDDLRDPTRGGAALIALATARDSKQPPQMPDIAALLKWLLVGAAAGIVGNRADALVVQVWNWLTERVKQETSIPDVRSLTFKEIQVLAAERRLLPLGIYQFRSATLLLFHSEQPAMAGFMIVSADLHGQILMSSAQVAPRVDAITVQSRKNDGPFTPPFVAVIINDLKVASQTSKIELVLEGGDNKSVDTDGARSAVVVGALAAEKWKALVLHDVLGGEILRRPNR